MMRPKLAPSTLLALERLAFAIQQKTSCIRVLDRAAKAQAPGLDETHLAMARVEKALEQDLVKLALLITDRE
jgi:hypothetical protein